MLWKITARHATPLHARQAVRSPLQMLSAARGRHSSTRRPHELDRVDRRRSPLNEECRRTARLALSRVASPSAGSAAELAATDSSEGVLRPERKREADECRRTVREGRLVSTASLEEGPGASSLLGAAADVSVDVVGEMRVS